MCFDDQCRFQVTGLAFFDEDATIDNGKIDILWLAKDNRRNGVMDCRTGIGGGAEVKADDVGCHARRDCANVVATQDCRTAKCGKLEGFTGAHRRWISLDTLQEHRLARFGQEMAAIVAGAAVNPKTHGDTRG